MTGTSAESPSEDALEGQKSSYPRLDASPVEFDRGALAWFSRASRSLGRAAHPFLDSIEVRTMDELPDDSVSTGVSSTEKDVPLHRGMHLKSEWTVPLDETLNFDLDEFITRLYTMSEEHASQTTKNILEHISAVSVEHGQVVDATGRAFFDAFCESLEQLEFVFDEEGNHNMALVVHPDNAHLLESLTPEQRSAIDHIVHRKREEWNAKRRRRNLPRLAD